MQVISEQHSLHVSDLILREDTSCIRKHGLGRRNRFPVEMFLSEQMCFVESRKISLSEEEVVEGERASRTQSCQVLVFRLRCDKLSQLKRAVKSSLQQRALSPCKSGQGRGSSISLYTSGSALLQLPQVVTKTFATQLFAKVSLLQHHLVYCVGVCVHRRICV